MDGVILKQEVAPSMYRYTVMVDGIQKATSLCSDYQAKEIFKTLGTHYEKVPIWHGLDSSKQSYI